MFRSTYSHIELFLAICFLSISDYANNRIDWLTNLITFPKIKIYQFQYIPKCTDKLFTKN